MYRSIRTKLEDSMRRLGILKTKDTLRLILWYDCNMSCYYCCNEMPIFNSHFTKKKLSEIDFSDYRNVCLTGGEIFLYPQTVMDILKQIPKNTNVYLYTNGTLLTHDIIHALFYYKNIKGINIGVHNHLQLRNIPICVDNLFKVRYDIEDKNVDNFMAKYKRLNENNVKPWKRNDCHMPNEEWVVVEDIHKEKWED